VRRQRRTGFGQDTLPLCSEASPGEPCIASGGGVIWGGGGDVIWGSGGGAKPKTSTQTGGAGLGATGTTALYVVGGLALGVAVLALLGKIKLPGVG